MKPTLRGVDLQSKWLDDRIISAQDRSTCKDWVINLNRVREARIQIGRMS
jgi:hypothetical protein